MSSISSNSVPTNTRLPLRFEVILVDDASLPAEGRFPKDGKKG